MKDDATQPEFLYKIVSDAAWKQSQEQEFLKLSSMDDEFIHLATKDQLPRILDKFWPDESDLVIAKLRVSKLRGDLVLESNPGGTTRYYHLYRGHIPMESVVETSRRP